MTFENTDFTDLADRVRTQSADAPGSDTERVTIRSLESLDTDALADLLEMAETEHDRPADLVFVLPQPPTDLAADASPEALEDALGRTVRVEEELPDDTVLLLTPDAVDGMELVEPRSITCGLVGRAADA
ncbi:uncharacterized protein Nmag_1499 [Natrialba magadii ATCC 43099]|uniref:Uncharacterized protein n=1 Tax=Natrialba magadii (strain ATCC 43099 / DSM 3394 / CCM 3739 / CIP 104546 / IAM 13178 / JCM 8861 / NBRC 102185 / NCIMB 2190 / MS3) TaxID=547559 RepID=D3STQ8_NATMM|nr:hypothetical protein [Natrialba magadii]ADD05075.1 uncharacterized protein Nmag_1499 [Natrialba magadii ATCC 43099]ELY23448.1 hypothetical protein C500_20019 [Natrialba magadii ATCC 43099]